MTLFERMLRITALCCGLALLAACSTTRVPGPTGAPATIGDSPGAGLYKVGKPYKISGIWYYPAEDYGYRQEGIASWYGEYFHGKRTANGEIYDMNAVSAAHPTLPLPSMVKVTNLDNGRVLNVRVNDRGPFKSSRIIDLSRRAAQLLGFYEAGTAHVIVEIDAPESLALKSRALKDQPPEMPQIAAVPRMSVAGVPLAPVGITPLDAAAVAPGEASKSVPAPGTRANAQPQLNSSPAPAAFAKVPAKAIPSEAIGGTFIQAGAFSDVANARRLEARLREFGHVFVLPVTVGDTALYRVRLGPVDDDTADALLSQVKSFGYEDAQVVRY